MGLNHPQNRDLSSNRSKTRMLNVEAGIPALTEVEELWSIRWTDERDKTGRCNICDFSMKFRFIMKPSNIFRVPNIENNTL